MSFITDMKYLIIIYNIYFIILMTIPCSHTILPFNSFSTAQDAFSHVNEHKEKHSSESHHSPCVPFCVCSTTTFVLNSPPLRLYFLLEQSISFQETIDKGRITVAASNHYAHLMVYEIWHPPQLV